MKQIDLEPNEIRRQGPDGRWRISDDPKLARNMMVVCLLALAFIFWKRNEFTQDTLFGVSAMFAFFSGGLFAIWLKDVY